MKQYLGHAVYVDYDAAIGLVLTTEDGFTATNTIFMDPEVYAALVEYVSRLWQSKAAEQVGGVEI
jgi:hypothetical protein